MWWRGEVYTGFLVGKPEGKRSLGTPILTWIFRKWDGGMDWIDLTKDRERWCACAKVKVKFFL